MRVPRALEEPMVNLEDWVLLDLLGRLGEDHCWTHVEEIDEFDGEWEFTLTQGED